jgi:hypothetical protein
MVKAMSNYNTKKQKGGSLMVSVSGAASFTQNGVDITQKLENLLQNKPNIMSSVNPLAVTPGGVLTPAAMRTTAMAMATPRGNILTPPTQANAFTPAVNPMAPQQQQINPMAPQQQINPMAPQQQQVNPMAPQQQQVNPMAPQQQQVNQALPNIAQRVSPSDIDLSKINVINGPPPVPNIADFVKSRQVILETIEMYKATSETENGILTSYRENNVKPKLDSITVANINTLYDSIVATNRWYPPPPMAPPAAPAFADFKTAVQQYLDKINSINTMLSDVPLAEYTSKFDNLYKLYDSINSYKNTLARIKIQPTYIAQREQLINKVDTFIQKLLKYMLTQYLEPILEIRQKIYVQQYDTNGNGVPPPPPPSKYALLRNNVIVFVYPAVGGAVPPARAVATALAAARGLGGVPQAPPGGGPPQPPHLRIYDTINFAAISTAFSNIQRQSDAQKTTLNGIYTNRQNRATVYGETAIQKNAKMSLTELQTIMDEVNNVKALTSSNEDQFLQFIKYLYDNLDKLKNIYQNFEDTISNQAATRLEINGIGKTLNDSINDITIKYNELRQSIQSYIDSGKSNEQFKTTYMEKIVNLNNQINTVKFELIKDFITKSKIFADHAANTGPNNGLSNRMTVFNLLKDALKLYDIEIAELVVNFYNNARAGGAAVVATQAEKETLRDAIVTLLNDEEPVIPQTFVGALFGRAPPARQPPTPENRRRRLAIANLMTTENPSALTLMEYLNDIGGGNLYNMAPLLSIRDGKKSIIELQGEVALLNEFSTIDETMNNFYKFLDRQTVFASDSTEYSTATATPQGPVNLQPFNRNNRRATGLGAPPARRPTVGNQARLSARGTAFRTLGDMRRQTIGFGGKYTKKWRNRSRNKRLKRQAKRQTKRQAKRQTKRQK